MDRVHRVLRDPKGLQSQSSRRKSNSLHVIELPSNNSFDGVLVVCLVQEEHVDGLYFDVGVFGLVDSREVQFFF